MTSPSSFSSSPAGNAFGDYQHTGRGSTGGGAGVDAPEQYWTIDKCKKAYSQYIANKSQEIEEQKNARRYYHGVHWTAEQVRELNKRKQPIVTFNRIARKLNGVVGLIERLKQDPKCYPRTPQNADGAELGTAVIRYALDSENWNAKSPEVALDAAVEGFAGISISLVENTRKASPQGFDRDDSTGGAAPMYRDDPDGGVGGGGSTTMGKPPGYRKGEPGIGHNGPPQQPDYEVEFEPVEADSFFYDPRSYRPDFSDARYMGEAKWLDLETAQELFPDHAEDLAASVEDSTYLSTNPDRESKFFAFDGGKHLIRLVDIWYKYKGQWCWSMFTGSMVLDSGPSYLFDKRVRRTAAT